MKKKLMLALLTTGAMMFQFGCSWDFWLRLTGDLLGDALFLNAID